MTIEEITKDIEARGLRWDVGCLTRESWEARIWNWPSVVARVRIHRSTVDACGMEALRQAYDQLDKTKYQTK